MEGKKKTSRLKAWRGEGRKKRREEEEKGGRRATPCVMFELSEESREKQPAFRAMAARKDGGEQWKIGVLCVCKT